MINYWLNRLYYLVLLNGLLLISCNSDSKRQSISQDISFKKEGTLKLKKADNDSVINILDIEIADNDYETQTGLMYRISLENNQAMLFIFPNEISRSFYMKNTRIPLDIIYISKDSVIVSFQKNAKPFDETSLPSIAPAKYVLEINAGLSDKWNLKIGDKIDF